MTDDLTDFLARRPATTQRPLLGLTILVVEDSRFASEAMRLLCLRSGARIRRADCLRSAHRHLRTYRPSVVIVDLGLPDGSGVDLIGEIKASKAPAPAVLAISGDPGLSDAALAAGADAFMPKPLDSLAMFQQAVLSVTTAEDRPVLLSCIADDTIAPDPLALRDDLSHISEVLLSGTDRPDFGYVSQFLAGVARSAGDEALEDAAMELGRGAEPSAAAISHLNGLVQERLAAGAVF